MEPKKITLKEQLDIDINYYVKVNFSTVVELVDTLGGIDVYADQAVTLYTGRRIKKGYNTLIYYNDFVCIYFKTELNDSARGYRWNDVILDAPIKKEVLDCVIRPKIIRKEQSTSYTFMRLMLG